MSDEEKQAIEYLKSRLYGNEGCKFIDVAQSDLRIFLKLVENLQKDIESWKKYCDEQENDITLKNNKICDLEFKIEKQSKEIEELKEENKEIRDWKYVIDNPIDLDKLKELDLIKIKGKEYISKNMYEELEKDKKALINNYSKVLGEFIPKDKIKAKIEEVQNMKAKAKDIVFKSSLNYIETELQSLLQEEESNEC